MPPESVDSSFPNRLPFQECEFTGIEDKKIISAIAIGIYSYLWKQCCPFSMTAYPIIAWIIGQRSRSTEIPNALRRIARTIRSRRRSSRRPRRRHGHHPHANTPHRCPGNRRDEGWHRGIHLQGNKSSDTKSRKEQTKWQNSPLLKMNLKTNWRTAASNLHTYLASPPLNL